MKKAIIYLFILILVPGIHQNGLSQEHQVLSKGQTIYVPAYSHIYSGNRGKPFLLTITLSIRNIDPVKPMTVHSVDYFESQGTFLKGYLQTPKLLEPMGSLRIIVPEKTIQGGSGANFIVVWRSNQIMNTPIVEAIMIGTQYQQGISFVSRGRALLK